MPLARYQPGPIPPSVSSSSTRTTPSRSTSAKRRNSVQVDVESSTVAPGAPITVEEFGPPEWRPVLSSKADLGYPDFYPCRPGFNQLEDVLNEENVTRGFQPKASIAVSSEGFSMHGMIHGQLKENALGKLDALAQELLVKRDETMPTLGQRTYRLPPRVTYNDIKRLAYIADLANPTVPLYKLARQSVPHGYKGVDLLETMWSPAPPASSSQAASTSTASPAGPSGPIQVDRAAWFVRILGANEVVMLRNRPANANALSTASWTGKSLTPSQLYTNEFTGVFMTFLRKQLLDLVLPQAGSRPPTASQTTTVAAGKQVASGNRNAGVLGDAAARARWVAKWEYSLELLRTLHGRYLISSRVLATSLADIAASSNLAQVGFVAQLTEEYMRDITKHVPLARSLLRTVLDKLAEIRRIQAQDMLPNVVTSLTRIIRAFFSLNPEIMLSPTAWLRHAGMIQEIVLSFIPTPPTTSLLPQKPAFDQESPASSSTIAISGILADSSSSAAARRRRQTLYNFTDIQQRNERLLSKSTVASPNSMSPRRQAMADIQKLDSLSATTQINDFMMRYFDGTASPTSASLDYTRLEEKIHILLVWALNVFTLGDLRPYAVCTLLKKWEEAYVSHRPPDAELDVDLFRPLYSWLDTSEAAQKQENIPAMALTFGELTREGIFSYGRYLQLLIAKGHTARGAMQSGMRSHHLDILEAFPIFVQDKGMLLQRRIVLYGLNSPTDKAKLKAEAETQARLRDEIARHVPELYGASEKEPPGTDWNPSELARSCSRYELVQARFWVFPLSVAFIDRLAPTSFVRMLNFFEMCRGYATVLDFILRALKAPVHDAVLNITLDTVRRDAEVWTAMDRQGQLANALLDKFNQLQSQGHFNSVLWKQLRHYIQQGLLAPSVVMGRRSSLQYAAELSEPTLSLGKVPSIAQISSLASASEIDTAVQAFLNHEGRLSKAQWDEVLRTFASGGSANARSFSAFMSRLESRSGVDTGGVISEWLEKQTPGSRLRLFGSPATRPVLQLLAHLAAVGCLQTTSLLSCLIYPMWTTLAEGAESSSDASIDRNSVAAATVAMATQLLLIPRNVSGVLPKYDIMEVKALETSRADAFRDPDALRLVRHLPLLVVLENEPELSDSTREGVKALRTSLSLIASFRTAAFRHLELLKDVFLAPLWARHRISALDARMIDALKAIMTDGGPSKPRSDQSLPPWSRNTARYSAWRWTRTVLELRLSFKQLAVRIVQGEEVESSRSALRELAQSMFSNDVNNDETDLICEAFRGVETVAVEQVVSSGVDHLTTLVEALMSTPPADPEQTLSSVQNVVRMLESILDAHIQAVDAPVDVSGTLSKEKLAVSLAKLLQHVSAHLQSSPADRQENLFRPLRPTMARLRVFLAIAKFHLALSTASSAPTSQKTRQSLAEAAVCTLDVIWHLPRHGPETALMAELLADVHCYMVDELPREGRPALQSALNKLQASNGSPEEAPTAPILQNLLPYSTPPRRPMNLIEPNAPDTFWLYDDRPWEASEQMEPSTRSSRHEDSFLDPTPFANNSSIPLSAFDPKFVRDKVPGRANDKPWLDFLSERNLGNGLAGEPPEAARLATSIFHGDFQAPQPAISFETYAATSPSVASTYTRDNTDRKSQTQSNGIKSSGQSTNDPIEIDDDDDEIEVVPPPAKRPRTSVSKPTTGMKTVARKAPSKVPKTAASTRGKGRRKSQAE